MRVFLTFPLISVDEIGKSSSVKVCGLEGSVRTALVNHSKLAVKSNSLVSIFLYC